MRGFVGRARRPRSTRGRSVTRVIAIFPSARLSEHALGLVDIVVDDEPRAPREIEEEQHVARRQRGDERLLRDRLRPGPTRAPGRRAGSRSPGPPRRRRTPIRARGCTGPWRSRPRPCGSSGSWRCRCSFDFSNLAYAQQIRRTTSQQNGDNHQSPDDQCQNALLARSSSMIESPDRSTSRANADFLSSANGLERTMPRPQRRCAPIERQQALTHRAHSGMLSCFFHGFSSCLFLQLA